MIRFVALALLASACFAQGNPNRFGASTGDVVLAGAGTKFTVQSNNGKAVSLETAVVYCSVACDVSQAQNGTAATTTAGSIVGIQPVGPPATAKVWTASNVGAGTTVPGTFHLLAGTTVVLDLSKVSFAKTTTSSTNYTVVVAPITGTANITFYWSEQ